VLSKAFQSPKVAAPAVPYLPDEDGAIKKVIVIGLDGLEPSIVSRLLAAGQLPNLSTLKEKGGFGRVATTRPAQTPVAWSTFATGTNPGGHGIFDFLRRNPKSYLPELALSRYEQKNVFLPPKAVNLRRGVPVWEILGAAGKGSTILRCPCTYPPDRVHGAMLSGLGVPDLRGGLGTSTFYTSKVGDRARESEQVILLEPTPSGECTTYLIGPRNPKNGADVHFELRLKIDREERKITLLSEGTPNALEIREGEWSEWLQVRFKLGLLQSVRGMVRFHLVGCRPELALYASPVNFDPRSPLFPISDPPEFASDLADQIGRFYTTGMVEDHAGLNNERISEAAYLDQCEIAWREREAMMTRELELFDEGLFYCLFDTPDRVQHLFWRYTEAAHPANRGIEPDSDYAQVIDDCYRRCDAIVGKALSFSDDNTLLVVLSDHGFNSFQRGVHLNKWLYDNGFLALRNSVKPGEEAGDLLRQVDWERTRAYSLGLGGIYLNLKGREEAGIVTAEQAQAARADLVRGLSGLSDPERGDTVAIRRALERESVYHGPYVDQAPDILVDFAPGYRISWSSSMGGIAESQFEDNIKKWSGDHIIAPECVPGVLFMNRPFQSDGARLLDLAPTILHALGVEKGSAMEGDSLLP
jgi:predicted AlkP superfamily phosphohydrolase/phosphomutase